MPSPTARTRIYRFPSHEGFVLVSVLLIVALATVLVVVASMMAQVERRAAANSAKIEQARGNALFALDVALNQLQTAAGPDQRVTARAEILDSDGATANVDGVNQPFWTGVWETGSGLLDVGTAPQRTKSLGDLNPNATQKSALATWLVSHPSTNATISPLDFVGATSGANRDAVVAASGYGAISGNVTVPIVPITLGNQTTGAYAYWVSDEGVKAKINIADFNIDNIETGTAGYAKRMNHFWSPGSPDLSGVPPIGGGQPFEEKVRTDPLLNRVISLASLKNIEGVNSSAFDVKAFSPDLTAHSMGVLSNVMDGGLKMDLTSAFEDSSDANSSGQMSRLMKGTSGVATGANALSVFRVTDRNIVYDSPHNTTPLTSTRIDGLQWVTLYRYYNRFKSQAPLWRAATATGGQNPRSAGIPDSAFSFGGTEVGSLSLGRGDFDFGTTRPTSDPVAPTVVLARMDVCLTSNLDAATNTYKLRLKALPMLVLWNPYSVSINPTGNATIAVVSNYLNVNLDNRFRITVDGVGIPPFDVFTPLSAPSISWLAELSSAAPFEPGEIRVFGLGANNVAPGPPAADISSLYKSVPNLSSTNPEVSVDYGTVYELAWPGTTNPNAVVRVTRQGALQLRTNDTTLRASGISGWPDRIGGDPPDIRVNRQAQIHPVKFPFSPLSGTWPTSGVQISSLQGNGYLLLGFNLRAKGLSSSLNSTYYMGNISTAPFMGNSYVFSDRNGGGAWKEINSKMMVPYSSTAEVQNVNLSSQWRTSWGQNSVGSSAATPENTRLVISDVPYQPLTSLGQFTHVGTTYHERVSFDAITFPSFSIGGSYASPDVPTSRNLIVPGTNLATVPFYIFDTSFAANQVLFDRYFLSTVPPARVSNSNRYSLQPSQLEAVVTAGNLTLPNSRMKPFHSGLAPTAGSAESTQAQEDLRDVQLSASRLLVDGAFNVNSTSVSAWAALLGSLNGNSLRLWDVSSDSPVDFGSLANPLPRFWSVSASGGKNQLWEGVRDLTDAQVVELAEKVVQEVKRRGPFLTMGDFLNRRLGSPSELSRKGALQAAIDSTNLNSAFRGSPINAQLNTSGAAGDPFGKHEYGPGASTLFTGPGAVAMNASNTALPEYSGTGAPGFVMQQDIVQAFAPFMTARSDTFIVRVYGEVRNKETQAVEGSAWGEAVLQRTPEYIDQTDPALSGTNVYGKNLRDATPVFDRTGPTLSPIVNTINRNLGRRFKIVSFRWLAQNEI